MKKRLLLPLLATLSLYAQDFEQFKEEALTKSPYLKANAMLIEQSKEQSKITTRYKNPTLALEASQFNQDASNTSDNGFRIELTQPLRLWGVGSDRDALSQAQRTSAEKQVTLTRAAFIKELSLKYGAYKRLTKRETLASQELRIAQKIADISKARFESGTIARVKYLQATLDVKRAKNNLDTLTIAKTDAYYKLLAFAGLQTEPKLESSYSFRLQTENAPLSTPELAVLQSRQKEAAANAALSANKLEWLALRAEYEKEPDQAIYRVGVNIPLVVFNAKHEEKKIAKLQAQTQQLLFEQTKTAQNFTLNKTVRLINKLSALQKSTQALINAQQELLLMYEDGYKIANINLVELQLIKNQMIRTQEKLIDINRQKENNIIEYNYLTGAYNE